MEGTRRSLHKKKKGPCDDGPPKKKKKTEKKVGVLTSGKNVKSPSRTTKKQMKKKSKSSKTANENKREKCQICGQLGNNRDLVYYGHPQYAVEECKALTNENLVVYSDGNIMERPQANITDFSIYDIEGHLCPPDSSLVIKNPKIYISGYLNSICSDTIEVDTESVPVKDIGPFQALYISGFGARKENCITISTLCADYNLQKPSRLYKPIMDRHIERTRISEIVVEFLQKHHHLKPAFKDFIGYLRHRSIPELNGKKIKRKMLIKHAQFICEQVNNLTNEENGKLITLLCMKMFIKLTGVKLDKNKKSKFKRVRNRPKPTKATTTPLVRKTFERFFLKQLDKTNQVPESQRCGICKFCQLPDCGVCKACRGMPKFGGSGRIKKTCVKRVCPHVTKDLEYDTDTEPDRSFRKGDYHMYDDFMKIKWIGDPVQIDERKIYYNKVEINDLRLCNGDYVILKTRLAQIPYLVARVAYMWKDRYFYYPTEGFIHAEVFIRSEHTVLGQIGDPREVFLHNRCLHGVPFSAIMRKGRVDKKGVPTDFFNSNEESVEIPLDDDGKTYFCRKFYSLFTSRFEDLPEDPTCPNEFRKHRFCPSCERKTEYDDKATPIVIGERFIRSPIVPADKTEWSMIRWRGHEYKKGCAVFLRWGSFNLKNKTKVNRKSTTQMNLKLKNKSSTQKETTKILKRTNNTFDQNVFQSKNKNSARMNMNNKRSTQKILKTTNNSSAQNILKVKKNNTTQIIPKPKDKISKGQRVLKPNNKSSNQKILKSKNPIPTRNILNFKKKKSLENALKLRNATSVMLPDLKNNGTQKKLLKPLKKRSSHKKLKSKKKRLSEKILKLNKKRRTEQILKVMEKKSTTKKKLQHKNSSDKRTSQKPHKPKNKSSTQRLLKKKQKRSPGKVKKQKETISQKLGGFTKILNQRKEMFSAEVIKSQRTREKVLNQTKMLTSKSVKQRIGLRNKSKYSNKTETNNRKSQKIQQIIGKSSSENIMKQKIKRLSEKILKLKKKRRFVRKSKTNISAGKVTKAKNRRCLNILKIKDISAVQKIIRKQKNSSNSKKPKKSKLKKKRTVQKKLTHINHSNNKTTNKSKLTVKRNTQKKTKEEHSKYKTSNKSKLKYKRTSQKKLPEEKQPKNKTTAANKPKAKDKRTSHKKLTDEIHSQNKTSAPNKSKPKDKRTTQKKTKEKHSEYKTSNKSKSKDKKTSEKHLSEQKQPKNKIKTPNKPKPTGKITSHKKLTDEKHSKNKTTAPNKSKLKDNRTSQKILSKEKHSKNKTTAPNKSKLNDNRTSQKILSKEKHSKNKTTAPNKRKREDKKAQNKVKTQIKRTTHKKSKLKQVDENVYTEYYRKKYKYISGSNAHTREPFCVGYIEAVSTTGYGELLPPQNYYLTVKIMYRPENTVIKYPHREDQNILYWSDVIRHVPFSYVTGPCDLIYVKNVPEGKSLQEWLDGDPNRFYFKHAYNRAARIVEKVPSHATTVGKVDNEKEGNKTTEATSESMEEKVRPLRMLDIFAGCGGLSEGLHRTGVVECRWAIENCDVDALAYSLNNKNCTVFTDDCNKLLRDVIAGAKYRGILKLPMRGDVEMLCGGPPCQGFTGMNRFTSQDGSKLKNSLIATFLSYCDYYRPKYVIMENVRDFAGFKQGMVLKLTMRALLDMGYQCTFGVLQAGHYGVPQSRRRFILLAAAPGCILPFFPEPTHVFSSQGGCLSVMVDKKLFRTNIRWDMGAPRRTVTVSDAISDLPVINNGRNRIEQDYRTMPLSHYQRMARRSSIKVTDHVCKTMTPLAQARIDRIPTLPGSDWRDLPNISIELSDGTKCKVLQYLYEDIRNGRSSTGAMRGVCACASGARCLVQEKQNNTLIPWYLPHTADRHAQWAGVYGRIFWGGYFNTVITDPEPTGKQGRVLHPTQSRVVSVRECARAQGFPDHYVFTGTVLDKYRQIGNAVPPPLGEGLGREFKKSVLGIRPI